MWIGRVPWTISEKFLSRAQMIVNLTGKTIFWKCGELSKTAQSIFLEWPIE